MFLKMRIENTMRDYYEGAMEENIAMRIPTELIPRCPDEIKDRSICIDADIGEVLKLL